MAKVNAKRKASSLFEDDDGDEEEKSAITINAEYAKRFEHNKRRTELHRLQAKHPELAARIEAREMRRAARGGADDDEEDDESESSEDEDEGFIPASTEKEWAEALIKIKSKDPSIYDAHTHLFQGQASEDEDDGDEGDQSEDDDEESAKSTKKKTLRDILYDQAVVEEKASDLDADTELERRARLRDDRRKNLVYDEEQRKLKSDLLSKLHAAEDADDEDGGLTKKRTLPVGPTEDSSTAEVQKMLDQYFGQQSKSKDDAFLQAYLKKRLWAADEDDGALQEHALAQDEDEAVLNVDAEEDEEFLDDADDFERQYNFRSEEPGGHTIQTFPRKVESTVRKEESKRKRQRESKQARAEAAKAQRKEELKQLKNLKKKEVHDALSQLQSIAGKAAPAASMLDELLNADFDPDTWDKHMADAFNDEYYNEKEHEEEILADDEAVQKAVEWADDDGDGSGDGDDGTFAAIHKRVTGKAPSALPENDYEVAEDAEDGDEDEADPTQLAQSRDKIQKLLQEYYKLDYEDDIHGLKTRFKYRQVEPIKDTLDAAEILAMTDKELNSIVGLKRLAPYRDDAAKIRPNYVALSEARKRLRALGFKKRGSKSEGAHGKTRSIGGGEREQGEEARETEGKAKVKKEKGPHEAGLQEGRGQKRKHVKSEDAEEGAPPVAKKKRPGPALRRALKAAMQEEGGPRDADGVTDAPTSAAAAIPRVKPERDGGGEASTQRKVQAGAAAAAKGHAKPFAHKLKTEPADGEGDTSKEAKKQRRLESFAKLALPKARDKPAGAGRHSVGEQQKLPASPGPGTTPAPANALPSMENMPRSQKKNLKRALKRRSSAPSSEA